MRQKFALTSDDCHKMMAACKAEAQKNKWLVAIAIVDDSGAAILLERLDGCGSIASTVAMGKAQTAALTGRPSKFFEDRVKERPGFVTYPTPGVMFQGGLPLVLLQCSGLGNSLNALTSLLIPYQIPVLIVVSMRGDAGEWNAAQVPMGQAVRGIFDAINIPHATVETPDGATAAVRLAGKTAFATRSCGACLLPRKVTTAALPQGDRRGLTA